MRFPIRALAALAMLAPALTPLAPASAGSNSAIVFQGEVTLPTFPCSGSGCSASFNSSLATGPITTDTAAGVVDAISATVTYSETCVGGQAVTGTAVGSATGDGLITGRRVSGGDFAVATTFSWLRVGLVALITNVVGDTVITGAAVFIPSGGLPTCTGGSVTATIAGAATSGSANGVPGGPPGGRIHRVRATLVLTPGISGVQFELKDDADPPVEQWSCVGDEEGTVSCQPPVEQRTRYVCEVLEVEVTHTGPAPMSGTSACGGGGATGVSPNAPNNSHQPGGPVPFSCSARPELALTWRVVCHVHP